jgi:hypothetical protein
LGPRDLGWDMFLLLRVTDNPCYQWHV